MTASIREVQAPSPADLESCLAIWAKACENRDGEAVPGVVERARSKFDRAQLWLVAETPSGIHGFALITKPGSGRPTDPPESPVLGLLAVSPASQGQEIGRHLLSTAMDLVRRSGSPHLALHVLTDNHAAVKLYESLGWESYGQPFEHSLLKRATQTYVVRLQEPPR